MSEHLSRKLSFLIAAETEPAVSSAVCALEPGDGTDKPPC